MVVVMVMIIVVASGYRAGEVPPMLEAHNLYIYVAAGLRPLLISERLCVVMRERQYAYVGGDLRESNTSKAGRDAVQLEVRSTLVGKASIVNSARQDESIENTAAARAGAEGGKLRHNTLTIRGRAALRFSVPWRCIWLRRPSSRVQQEEVRLFR